ncbi:hypothetical protein B0H12DRAFT_1075521 [Mycena haematopus]|nr:hypothetical protein B0H12DRAFT_1075521 [Mycena haematopus]
MHEDATRQRGERTGMNSEEEVDIRDEPYLAKCRFTIASTLLVPPRNSILIRKRNGHCPALGALSWPVPCVAKHTVYGTLSSQGGFADEKGQSLVKVLFPLWRQSVRQLGQFAIQECMLTIAMAPEYGHWSHERLDVPPVPRLPAAPLLAFACMPAPALEPAASAAPVQDGGDTSITITTRPEFCGPH